MTTPELAVIAPCFNEELNVDPFCARMLAVFDAMPVQAELLLIDDGSKDDTWARITETMRRDPRVRGVRHEQNKGIVGGWLSGLANTTAPIVCLIDSDLQNRPEDIPRLYASFSATRPDIVQAVRNPKVSGGRLAFSKGLNALLNVTFGMHLRDNKSGFIVCRREVLADILKDAPGYRYFQSFIGVAAGVRRFRIEEVDTDFDARNAGESFLSNFPVMVSLRIFQDLLRYRLETLRRPRT
ncbi:glycosyltransferase family 2 protein [Nannocystis sp.]|uniref:glycosyltransferase family 2 protein n=1 Tax=Nannocystis sp. TaxID=1962667 RepID=UPI0024269DD1|nr:glycosyltransferase family 2 protein [Nannocystis sp.]MBK7827487.1 glycosyltransferase family 2 protein [Nannocystis sp.]MBK9756368.1 glycosyltransferase family 2 protein [Nannocystis sp.]